MKGVRNLSIFPPWVRLASVGIHESSSWRWGFCGLFGFPSPRQAVECWTLPTTGHLIGGQGGAWISRTLAWACFGLACLPSSQVLRASLLGPKGVDKVDALPSAGREILRFLGRLERNRKSSTAAQRARGVPGRLQLWCWSVSRVPCDTARRYMYPLGRSSGVGWRF